MSALEGEGVPKRQTKGLISVCDKGVRGSKNLKILQTSFVHATQSGFRDEITKNENISQVVNPCVALDYV